MIASGLVLSAVGLLILVHVHLPLGLFLFSVGIGPIPSLATDLVVSGAPSDRAGAAAALSETGSELGGALGIALLGALGSVIYRHHAGAVGDTLASAVDPTPAARAAFVDAFTVTAMVGAVILVATAGLVLRRPRAVPCPA
ncbi:MAG: hypothetical protein ABI678_26650 [Kofleriaceae bacterium]